MVGGKGFPYLAAHGGNLPPLAVFFRVYLSDQYLGWVPPPNLPVHLRIIAPLQLEKGNVICQNRGHDLSRAGDECSNHLNLREIGFISLQKKECHLHFDLGNQQEKIDILKITPNP